MSIARLESRLRLIQTAIEKQQGSQQEIETYRIFKLVNLASKIPRDNVQWEIMFISIAHVTGTASNVLIQTRDNQYNLYSNTIPAATANINVNLDLLSSRILIDNSAYIWFTGDASAQAFIGVRESYRKLNIVRE